MHSISQIAELFLDGFDRSARAVLQNYLAGLPHVGKWMIAADFCMHNKERPYDALAFSLIPYDDDIQAIAADVQAALPGDIKKSKYLSDKGVAWLRDPRRFHVVVTVKKARQIFVNEPVTTPLQVARECVELTLQNAIRNGATADAIARLKSLKQQSQAKGFNVDLLGDIFLFVAFCSAITTALARERNHEIVGWFPDRDSMTNWCEGFWYDLAHGQLGALCDQLNFDMTNTKLFIGAPDESSGTEVMWYDYLIRAPDWLAGTFSAYDRDLNQVPGKHRKYLDVLEKVMPGAPNIVLMHLNFFNKGIQFSRLDINTKPPATPHPETDAGATTDTTPIPDVPEVDPQHFRQALNLFYEWAEAGEDNDPNQSDVLAKGDLHELLDKITTTLEVSPETAVALFKRVIALSAFCARQDHALADELFEEDGAPGRELCAAAAKAPVRVTQGDEEGEIGHGFDDDVMQQALKGGGN